jgi:molybdate transport system substrate-binding protein
MARRPKVQSELGKWADDWSVGVRVWVERRGETVLDESIADVLMALDRLQSISAAARSLGISYRHAWLLIESANENSGRPLTATAVGGQRGGGTQLTEHGQAALAVFQQVQRRIREAAAGSLSKTVRPGAQETSVIHVAAAISLQEVLSSLLSQYALVRPTIAVRTIFGASNELAEQIASGAPVDVFLSANCKQIDALAKAGLVERTSRRKLASNGLAFVGNKSFAGKFRTATDLVHLDFEAVVVADPACPLGTCTAKFLKAKKLTRHLQPKLQVVENSRAVVNALREPERRIGIIFGSDLVNAVHVMPLLQVPLDEAMTVYEGATISTSKVLAAAEEFLGFLSSQDAVRSFRRFGFSARPRN